MINLSFTPMMIAAACDSLQCFDIFIECRGFDIEDEGNLSILKITL